MVITGEIQLAGYETTEMKLSKSVLGIYSGIVHFAQGERPPPWDGDFSEYFDRINISDMFPLGNPKGTLATLPQ